MTLHPFSQALTAKKPARPGSVVVNDRRYRTILEGSKPSEEPAAAGERDIIAAAIEVFGRKGYAASSLREIAEHAAVTAPLISYHFGNKEGLYTRCVDVVLGALNETAMEAVREDDGLVDAVSRFTRAHIEFSSAHPTPLRFALGMAYGPTEGQPNADWTTHYAMMFGWASERFERAEREGEFRPRPDTNSSLLLRHLFHIVHLEVFSAYERIRFAEQFEAMQEMGTPVDCGQLSSDDAVQDVVRQFFFGAGEVSDAF
jgi:AcrR family transcriptional regulator